MQKKWLLMLALSLCVAGCTPVDCLNPLYTDRDVISDPALPGDWHSSDPDDKGITRITEFTEPDTQLRAYDIRTIDNDDIIDLHAHLVNLGGQHFLDVVLQKWDSSSDSYLLHVSQSKDDIRVEPRLLRLGLAAYMEFVGGKGGTIQSRLRPAHWFIKVTSDGKKLRFDCTDDEKLAKTIAAGDLHISHLMLGEGKKKDIVVTAETQELQKFVLEHMDDERVFSEHSDTLIRRQPPQQGSRLNVPGTQTFGGTSRP